MKQFRKRILIPLLCAGLLLTTTQSGLLGSAADDPETEVADTDAAADTGSEEGGDSGEDGEEAAGDKEPAEHITEEQALAEMTLYASTSKLELYVNEETAVFAVKDLEDGHYVWSNPYDAANDEGSKSNAKVAELMSSMLINSVAVTDVDTPMTQIRSARYKTDGDGFTTIEKIDNGFKGTVEFAFQGITVPYYVTLEDDHFDIRVAVNEIHEVELDSPKDIEESTRSVVDLGLFANLGAGYMDETGYIVIPDGSGAVINFNNGKQKSSEYSQKIYGKDMAISQDMAPSKTEKAHLPILGIVRENDALLEIVTEGAAHATARAAVAGQRATGYNNAYFEFAIRSSDAFYLGAVNATPLKSYEQNRIPQDNVSVRYYPIAKENASYVDIANRYQKYLLDEGLMSKKGASDSPLYIDLYGGTIKEQSVLGLPVKKQTSATTYSEAKEILSELVELGADDMVMTYIDFNKAGLTDRISSGVDFASKLGGKKDFRALEDFCKTNNIVFAPSVDLMEFERGGNGYSKTGQSVIALTKAYATLGEYELAYGTPNDLRSHWFLLTPSVFQSAYNKVVNSFKSEGLSAVSFGNGTNMAYSDFSTSANKTTYRQKCVDNLVAAFNDVANSGLTFVASACNDYALKYVDYIRNVPMYSSGYDVSDYDIPLYQMVIHGYIPYSSKALNASSDADQLLLMSMVTASPLHYEFMYENPNKFTDSKYETLYYTYYKGWIETAAKEYKVFKEYISEEASAQITDYKIDGSHVECTFDNGTVISADLEEYTLTVNGKSIELPEKSWKGAAND